MPIRPELRKFYRAPWRAYRRVLIELAGGKCVKCHAPHPMLNGAHPHHDPRDGTQVCIWCPSCHARHDAPHRLAVMRRTRARRTGQLWLLPELEYAADPAWMTPAAVLRAAQQELFG
jgi:hypothetical protein